MKKTIIILAISLSASFCHGQNVTVEFGFRFKPKSDSITIAILHHDGKFAADIMSLDTIFTRLPGSFDTQLQPGTYIFKFLHPEISTTEIPLVIKNLDELVEISVDLERINLPTIINSVQLIVRSKSRKTEVISLSRIENKWTVPDMTSLPKDIEKYVFRINNSQYYHRPDYPVILQRVLLYHENEYNGEDIYFNEENYYNKKSTVAFKSNRDDLEKIYAIYNQISAIYESSYIGQLSIDSISNNRYYAETSLEFDKIIEQEYPYFKQLVIEPYLNLIDRNHPLQIQLREVSKNGDIESSRILKQSSAYKEMVRKKLELLKLIDTKSPFHSGSFLNAFRNYFIDFRTPYDYEDYNIPFGFFMKLENDFSQNSTSNYAKGAMLIREISKIKRVNPDRALELVENLENSFPYHPYVKQRKTDNLKKELMLTKGVKAPAFKLNNLEGEAVKLSDFRGKYIFLDFWGTWCAPCMSELPHIKELSESISEKQLIVIGVACRDKKERVQKTIIDKKLQYLIMMGSDEIVEDYGISAYPTTFLINPEGIIIGKNLRGPDLRSRTEMLMKL